MTPHRPVFWDIETTWPFYLLAALAVGAFLFGVWIHLKVWEKAVGRRGIPMGRGNFRNFFLDGLLGRRIFRGDTAAGILHFLILWGFLGLFVGTALSSLDDYVYPFLKGRPYLVYSACLEVAGLFLLLGLSGALFRRYLQRVTRLERRPGDLLVPVWLFLAAFSGFLVEGARLAAQRPEWISWSFVGRGMAALWSDPRNALSIYPYIWWTHALLSLGLIAAIPFTKLFHVLAAPASIYLENQTLEAPMEERRPEEETFAFRDMVCFDACTRCGRCVEVCPAAGAGEPFAPRDFIVNTRKRLLRTHHPLNRFNRFRAFIAQKSASDSGFDARKVWHCTTCRACLEVCPVYVATPDAIRAARVKVVEEGTQVPALLTQTLEKLYKYNNPWEASKKRRAAWAEGIEIPDLTKTEEEKRLCYFVGCTTSLDTRAQELARSLARILRFAGIPFGTLGKREPCCGDIARRVGEQGLFQEQMDGCLDLFGRHHIQDVVTSSPHCFHTFRHDYPAFQALKPEEERTAFQVRHYSQLLKELLSKGLLRFERALPLKVTYHDPCYLGRHNRIYEDPREVIRAIPQLEFVEMLHNRADSLCCGGGGGRMWQEELEADVKMSEIRIKEAAATGAAILVTACPLCLIMLEDARKTAGLEDTLRIMDLNELVETALGLGEETQGKAKVS